jgi:hypothetical protein
VSTFVDRGVSRRLEVYPEENYNFQTSVGAAGMIKSIQQQKYRLDKQGIRVQFPSRVGVFPLLLSI